jgi:hypothetical protein
MKRFLKLTAGFLIALLVVNTGCDYRCYRVKVKSPTEAGLQTTF